MLPKLTTESYHTDIPMVEHRALLYDGDRLDLNRGWGDRFWRIV